MAETSPEKRRFIESSCLFTNRVDSPFADLFIEDSSFLNDVAERGTCPCCKKSRRYYCYNCYVPVSEVASRIPCVKLPVKIDIIKHPKEVDGKSTSAHAAVLAPDSVQVFTFPDFPDYSEEKVLLIFPGRTAKSLRDLLGKSRPSDMENGFNHIGKSHATGYLNRNYCSCLQDIGDDSSSDPKGINCSGFIPFPYDRVVFIDSTWRQSKKIYGHSDIRKLPCCILTSHKSLFWRHQRNKPETHLATVEAVYYFLVELHQLQHPGVPYCGRYDNLLFFFKFMYYKIRTLYDPSTLKAYQK